MLMQVHAREMAGNERKRDNRKEKEVTEFEDCEVESTWSSSDSFAFVRDVN
jgi:hypothetical protein